MSTLSRLAGTFLLCCALTINAKANAAESPHLGQPISPADIEEWDISIQPDGSGPPPGNGTSAKGTQVFADNCSACHGEKGEGGIAPAVIVDRKRNGIDGSTESIANYWPF